jgi:hypothetical protein
MTTTTIINGDVTVTVAGSVANELLERAGLATGDDGQGWRLRAGHNTSDPCAALADALVAISPKTTAPRTASRTTSRPSSRIATSPSKATPRPPWNQYRGRVGEIRGNEVIATPAGEVPCATVHFGHGLKAVIVHEYLATV